MNRHRPHGSTARRVRRAALATALALSALALAPGAPSVSADTAENDPLLPQTLSADALPTVQINGVVWDQAVIGDRVYATGSFTQARPAGAAAGTNQTARSNILAFNIRTGQLITSWAPTLNAQGLVIEPSADGTRLYVGGDFTSVSGQARSRLVALDATTGAVVSGFAPSASDRVSALKAVGGTLYVGGSFTAMSGQSRTRLAAVNATTGALTPWAPATDGQVLALASYPPANRIIIGGSFTTLNGADNPGMGAVDATSGDLRPWAANQTIRNIGANSAISDFSTDGQAIFGVGWAYFGGGAVANFEGQFSADPVTGQLNWVNGCRGDNYGIQVMGDAIYTAGHAHDCAMIGANPQYRPDQYQRGQASTKAPSPYGRTNAAGPYGNWRPFAGLPSAEPLHWLPTIAMGTYTGQYQGPWTVEGNSDYLVMGGEFPSVNGTAQQGLVRFTRRELAPNREGPQGSAELTPTLAGAGAGALRVGWTAAWDRDNDDLTYQVLRGANATTATVLTTVQRDRSVWWARPPLGFIDRTAPPGSTQTYRIRVTDPLGNTVVSAPTTAVVPAGAPVVSPYAAAVAADGPTFDWRLGDNGLTAQDSAGSQDLTLGADAVRGVPGAITGDVDTATRLPGTTATTTVIAQPTYADAGPQTFSVEAWVNTTSTAGGQIIGYGDSATGRSRLDATDRKIYMTTDGRFVLGARPNFGDRRTVSSAAGFNDGAWHHVVGTLGPAGMTLYVDGVAVATDPTVTSAQVFRGSWRVGGDQLGGWPNAPAQEAITATLDEVAVYPRALTPAQVAAHFAAAGGAVTPNVSPTASFMATASNLVAQFDASGSSDPDGSVVGYAWNFGDGTSSSGSSATTSHAYAAAGNYVVTLTVTDDRGATATTQRTVTATLPPNVSPAASFTAAATNLVAQFDASGSSDPDGSVVGYAWNFGDGTTTSGSSATTSHTYAAAGNYVVTLTVTDDRGATASTQRTVTATAPPAVVYASDTFTRTVSGGLGSADTGGPWTLTGTAADYSVSGGVGRLSAGAPGISRTALLGGVQQTATVLTTSVSLGQAPTGNGAYVSLIGRRVGTNNDYRLKLRFNPGGTVSAYLSRTVAGTETTLQTVATLPGITYVPGTSLNLRLVVAGTGTTSISAKVWAAGTTEPAADTMQATDSTAAIQAAGSVGVQLYQSASATQSPIVLSIDNFTASAPV